MKLRGIACKLIRIYQRYIRIYLASECRFCPTCSEYARLAITKYGLFKGALKSAKRLISCHPFSGKGCFDPLI